jgi:hypothetical protein
LHGNRRMETASGNNRLVGALLLAGATFSALPSILIAQTEGLPSIRVEAQEVVIPAFVLDKTHSKREVDPYGKETLMEMDTEITGLSAKDFHVFEDGVEQRVESVAVEPEPVRAVADNVSRHEEYSCTPRGIWACSDVEELKTGPAGLHMYLISYVPAPSTEGSCHRIKVKVHHNPRATVYARDQYCSVNNFSFDSLNGSKLGKQLEEVADSEKSVKLPLSVQAGSFRGNREANRVAIAVEFPWRALERESDGCFLHASVRLLGLVYQQDGTLVTRFSDVACYGTGQTVRFESGPPGCGNNKSAYEFMDIPTRYETQVDLPPGEYDLKVAITDGAKFGRVKTPLNVDNYSGNTLGISGVILCKRFRQPVDRLGGQASVAPQYIPLISKGVEFTPAGDTRFRKGDRLIAYFELYQPKLPETGTSNLQFRMRVTNVKTGDLKKDTGLRSANSWSQLGNLVIAIAQEIAIDGLSKGIYRLEVRASDSVAGPTAARETTFTVE